MSTPIAGIRVAKQWRRRNTPFSVFALNPAARMSADGPRTSAAVIAAMSISPSAGAMCLRYWPRQIRSGEGFASIFAQRRLPCRRSGARVGAAAAVGVAKLRRAVPLPSNHIAPFASSVLALADVLSASRHLTVPPFAMKGDVQGSGEGVFEFTEDECRVCAQGAEWRADR